jgi:hypothetical protein
MSATSFARPGRDARMLAAIEAKTIALSEPIELIQPIRPYGS